MNNDAVPTERTCWPHAPTHLLADSGTYFVTASTYQKQHHFNGSERLSVLQRGLLAVTKKFGWRLEAWAVFSNHYHFVAHSPMNAQGAESLSIMLQELHAKTARWVNQLDNAAGRKVWFNFRETRLTYQPSYFARLNYIHQNPVRHGLVESAALYPWCSAAWFERVATTAQVKSIYCIKIDSVRVNDDFQPTVAGTNKFA